RRLHARDAVVDRPAGAQRLRRRVPHPPRQLRHAPVVDRGRCRRRHPRRRLPPLGVPTRVPRHAQRGERADARPQPRRRTRVGAARRRHPVHRRVPEADARAHRAVGRQARRPRRGALELPPAGGLRQGEQQVIAAASAITPIATPRMDWAAAAPLLILTGAALLLLLVSSLTTAKPGRGTYAIVTVLACAFAIGSAGELWARVTDHHRGAFTTAAGALTVDGFSVFFIVVIALGIALAALLADDYLRRENLDGPELY